MAVPNADELERMRSELMLSVLRGLTPEERQQLLEEAFSPEDRLQGLAPEARLQGLSREERKRLKQLLEQQEEGA